MGLGKRGRESGLWQGLRLGDTAWGARASRARLGLPLKDPSEAGWERALEESFLLLGERAGAAFAAAEKKIATAGPMERFYGGGLSADAERDDLLKAEAELTALARQASERGLGRRCAELVGGWDESKGRLPALFLMATLAAGAAQRAAQEGTERALQEMASVSELWGEAGALGPSADSLPGELRVPCRQELGLALARLVCAALSGAPGQAAAGALIEALAGRAGRAAQYVSGRDGGAALQRRNWAQFGEESGEEALKFPPSVIALAGEAALGPLPSSYWLGFLSGLDEAADDGLDLAPARELRRWIVERAARSAQERPEERAALAANLWLRLDREGLAWARAAAPGVVDSPMEAFEEMAREAGVPVDLERLLFLVEEGGEARNRGAWAKPAFEAAGLWPRSAWQREMSADDALERRGAAAFEAARAMVEAEELDERTGAGAPSTPRRGL